MEKLIQTYSSMKRVGNLKKQPKMIEPANNFKIMVEYIYEQHCLRKSIGKSSVNTVNFCLNLYS